MGVLSAMNTMMSSGMMNPIAPTISTARGNPILKIREFFTQSLRLRKTPSDLPS